jgi:hypothetical protein
VPPWSERTKMAIIPFEILAVNVLITNGTDKISISLAGPTTFPEVEYPLNVTIEARKGHGALWVREHLGVEPTVINTVRG